MRQKNMLNAVEYHHRGDLSEAKNLYEKILQEDPTNFDALHLSGLISYQSHRYAEAEKFFLEAMALGSSFAPLNFNFGVLLNHLKRYDESLKYFETAIRIKSDYGEAFLQRGLVLKNLKKQEEAISSFEQGILIKPDLFDAYFHRADLLMQLNRMEEAISSYETAIFLNPKTTGYYKKYGFDLQVRCRFDEALAIYDRAILHQAVDSGLYYYRGVVLQDLSLLDEAVRSYDEAISFDANNAVSYYNRANTLKALGRFGEALQSYDAAIKSDPKFFDAYLNRGVIQKEMRLFKAALSSLGNAILLEQNDQKALNNRGAILQELKHYDAAIADLNRAIEINPRYAEAYNNRGNVFKDIGYLNQALEDYKQAKEHKKNYVSAYSNYLFTMNYIEGIDENNRMKEAVKFGDMMSLLAERKFNSWHTTEREKLRRIGFVSADFINHPVGYFLKSLLLGSKKNAIQFIAYSNNPYEDDLTHEFEKCFHKFRRIFELDDNAAAKLIHSDEVDILIDMAGHTAGNRLATFACKPAPIQLSWLGYFATTGLIEMDYVLGDPYVTPIDEQNHFTEKIKRLPETYFCFTPPTVSIDVGDLPALKNGYITFGCFNNFSKVNEAVIALWVEVLKAVEGSRLFLKASQFKDAKFVEDTKDLICSLGVSPERLCFEGPTNRAAYFRAYNKVDIALDPFPYPGGTTSVEGLWMGVPVITKKGIRFISHNGETIAHNCGQKDWIAENDEEYIRKAVQFTSDLTALAKLRSGLRSQVLASPLFDAERFGRNFETAMMEIWEDYKTGCNIKGCPS